MSSLAKKSDDELRTIGDAIALTMNHFADQSVWSTTNETRAAAFHWGALEQEFDRIAGELRRRGLDPAEHLMAPKR